MTRNIYALSGSDDIAKKAPSIATSQSIGELIDVE
jgi:hypothetical protein